MVDIIIIGGGTAGLTAAIYVQRSALQCVVLESEEFGGRIFPSLAVDNYPAMPGVTGADYSEKLREQAESLGAELVNQTAIAISNGSGTGCGTGCGGMYGAVRGDGCGTMRASSPTNREGCPSLACSLSYPASSPTNNREGAMKVSAPANGSEAMGASPTLNGCGETKASLTLNGCSDMWQVSTSNNTYAARAVIFAAGEKHRLLGVPGEAEFFGRGVATCAACDGAFFRNKDVVIIGGGDKALDDVLTLARLCNSVHLIHRRDEFRAAGGTVAQVKNTPNVSLHLNRIVTSIFGTRRVEGVTLRDAKSSGNVSDNVDNNERNKEETLAVSGVFIAIGSIPQTALCAQFVQLDEQGYIIAGEDCVTSALGLFAAGDVRRKPLRQLVTAAADGAVAAKAAADYITHIKK